MAPILFRLLQGMIESGNFIGHFIEFLERVAQKTLQWLQNRVTCSNWPRGWSAELTLDSKLIARKGRH